MRLIVESIRHPSQEEMLPGWGAGGGGGGPKSDPI